MIRMARRVADGLMMSDVVPEIIADCVAIARQRGQELRCPDDPFRVSNFWAWHVKKDRAQSLREARRELILRGWLTRYHLSPFMSAEDCDFIEAHKQAFLDAYVDKSGDIRGVPQRIIDRLVEHMTFSGDFSAIDRHAETLRKFAAAGLTEIALRLHDDQADALRVIGERLMPALGVARDAGHAVA